MDIYSREELAEQKDLRKHAKTAMFIISAAAVLLCVVLLCCVDPIRSMSFRVITSIALSLAGCFDIYMLSFVLPYMRPKPKKRTPPGKVLKVLYNILHQLHMYVIWIILALMISSFLFNCVTDTTAAKKVTIFVDVQTVQEAELEIELNKDLPQGIKMTKVHTFSYSVFGMNTVGSDDIYIVRESDIEKYIDGFAPLSGYFDADSADSVYDGAYYKDGVAYGLLVRSNDERICAASKYIQYEILDGAPQEEYFLFFGKNGLHPGQKGAAAYIAKRLLVLDPLLSAE